VSKHIGTGKIYKEGKLLGKVRYDLVERQDRIDSSSKQQRSSMGGEKSIYGSLTPSSPSQKKLSKYPLEKLTLELEDGRKVVFMWSEDRRSGNIECTGRFYE